MVTGTTDVQDVLDALRETSRRCAVRIAELEDLGHELRTPLNGIVATVDLLTATALDATQTELVATLTQSAERLIDVVDQVADAAEMNVSLSALAKDADAAIGQLESSSPASTQPSIAATAPVQPPSQPVAEVIPATAPAASVRPAPPPVTTDDSDEGGDKKLRVLVAEDNTTNQLVVRSLLERMGHTCRVVENGQLAVDAVQEEPFDVILMDCMMPVLDGFGATRAIRALDASCATIPILALTANAMKGDRERCLESGMTEYMAKPVRLDVLTDMLARFACPQAV